MQISRVIKKHSSGISDRLDKTVERLKTALSKGWDAQVREFLLGQVGDAEALGLTGKLDFEELERLELHAKEYLGEGLREAARRPVIEAHNDTYALGKRAAGVDFSLTQADLNTLNILEHQSLTWVRDAYENNISAELNEALRAYFKEGLTRIHLSERLEELLSKTKRPKMLGYFDLLADHVATRAAEIGHVSGYEDADVEAVEVVAVLDDRTSDICRHMHGRIISVSTLAKQRDSLLEAARNNDYDAAKRAQPMLSGKRAAEILSMDRTSDITGSSVGLPPYHFRCRTTTVARFEPADYHERVREWAINGEVPKKELSTLIQYAANASWGTHPVTWQEKHGGDGEKHPAVFVHYKRHAAALRANSMAEYNEAAMNLIRGGSRDVYLTIEKKEHPYPVLLFHNPKTRELVVVNVKGQRLASYHRLRVDQLEKKLPKLDVSVKLGGGVMKWIKSALS